MYNYAFYHAGANTNIRNNEKQVPYDLSAKNPEVGRLLMVRGKGGCVCVCVWSSKTETA